MSRLSKVTVPASEIKHHLEVKGQLFIGCNVFDSEPWAGLYFSWVFVLISKARLTDSVWKQKYRGVDLNRMFFFPESKVAVFFSCWTEKYFHVLGGSRAIKTDKRKICGLVASQFTWFIFLLSSRRCFTDHVAWDCFQTQNYARKYRFRYNPRYIHRYLVLLNNLYWIKPAYIKVLSTCCL